MRIEIDVNIPEGFEATGEYRRPNIMEFFLDDGKAQLCPVSVIGKYIILRKKLLTGQAWMDSLPNGTVFMCGSLAYQKCSGDAFAVGATDPEWDKEWSDATCKILYRPAVSE